MTQNTQLLEKLQEIVTLLSQQAEGHAIQSRVFKSEGFEKLAEKYKNHASEEHEFTEKFVDRILDLGGNVKNGSKEESPIFTNPIEFIKYDLEVSRNGLVWLGEIVELSKGDITTYDLLKDYYKDEEEDMYWSEQQLGLIEKIGEANWYTTVI